MKQLICIVVCVAMLSFSVSCTQYHAQGAGIGAGVGGAAGAILDHKNRWRGGVIGAGLGALLGTAMADVSVRASRESAQSNRPVEYRTDDGRGVYRADPIASNEQTRCKKVRERIWDGDRLVKDQVREVCDGQRTEPIY